MYCDGGVVFSILYAAVPGAGLTENARIECGAAIECPHPCRCADGIVDCREKSLSTVPNALPEETTEL